MTTIYDFKVKDIKNKEWDLADLKGKVVLFVNVASKCALQKYEPKGFVIVGSPCNQFGGQEPGSEEEIQNFCTLTWSVTFPLTAKLDVNGDNEAPLYKFLKASQPGILGLKRVKWNFEKFLVNREGKVVKRFASTTEPKSIADDIEKLL
ncbi:thioredoxin-like protein [Mucor lusitanicus]